MHSDEDDAESEQPERSRRVVRDLAAGARGGPADRLLQRIEGELDVSAFLAVVGEVLERHHDGPGPDRPAPDEARAQRRTRRQAFADLVTYQRVEAPSEDDFARYANELVACDARLSRERPGAAPFRMRLLRYRPDLHVFTVAFPHAPVDVSVRRAFSEKLWCAYDARVDDGCVSSAAQPRAGAYWRDRIAALPADPTPAPPHRPAGGGPSVLEIGFRFSGEPLRRMRESARRSGTNEFVWSQCAFANAVFAHCPAGAIAIWVPADARSTGAHSGPDAPAASLPLVIERADSPAQLVRAVTREWLSMLRLSGAEQRLELARPGGREPARTVPAGTLRVAYVNHAQEQMSRTFGRSLAHPGGYAPAVKRETAGVHMLVQSWTEHLGVTLTFNTQWIAPASARSLARSIEDALHTWTASTGEQPPARAGAPSPVPEA